MPRGLLLDPPTEFGHATATFEPEVMCTGTAWFGCSLRSMEGTNRYGVSFFRLTLGWRLGALCAIK